MGQTSQRQKQVQPEYSDQCTDSVQQKECCLSLNKFKSPNIINKCFVSNPQGFQQDKMNNLDKQESKDEICNEGQQEQGPQKQIYDQISLFSINQLMHCDYIEFNNAGNKDSQLMDYFVLSKFTTYFGQFNIEASQKEGNGWIIQRQFDKNFNSSYFHYEGQFKDDQIVGIGKLFIQKSKQIFQEGEWSSIKKNIKDSSKIRIIAETSLHNISYQREFKSNSTTVFHDQLLNQQDLNILKGKKWLNSSIIDAYIDHLNYEDEKLYWSLSSEDRKQYKRLQIIPSWLFSWFHKGQNEFNLKHFKEVFSQFEPIHYRIWKIYRKIGFVINQNDQHWYFVQLDFETMEILVKDSMRGYPKKYATTLEILQTLFNQIDNKLTFTLSVCQNCLQQQNSYDCGAYTCINAKELAEEKQEQIDGTHLRQLLLNLFQSKYN